MSVTMTMTEAQHALLSQHLFPEDGCEAVAIALCGRASSAFGHRLLVRRLEMIPYAACSVRRPGRVTWPTNLLVPLLAEAAARDWAVVKIHGHTGYDQFSSVDDESDRQLFPSLYSWTDTTSPHASAIVMRDGRVFGRTVADDSTFTDLAHVAVVGDDIRSYHARTEADGRVPEFGRRVAQTFGGGTYDRLILVSVQDETIYPRPGRQTSQRFAVASDPG